MTRMAAKFFIQEHLHKKVVHGSICNVDAERIFMRNGFEAIVFPCIYDFSFKAKAIRFAYLIKTFFKVKARDIVVFQFPLHAKLHYLLLRLLVLKKVHCICFIADIEGIRMNDKNRLVKENRVLQQLSFFIVHNPQMNQWLQSVVPNAVTAQIEFFDYLTTPLFKTQKKDYNILFAGNLQKSEFVQHLDLLYTTHPKLTFIIYGPDCPEPVKTFKNVVYKGIFEPYDLINHVDGSFGLVWDGTSIESCAGNYGEYLAYNTPHKLSLYIMAGIPMIVPAMSATARLVEKYGIGCTIEKLADIEDVINSIDERAYQAMVQNMRSLALKISEGKCVEEALAALEQRIKQPVM
jgi:hypothetical protein